MGRYDDTRAQMLLLLPSPPKWYRLSHQTSTPSCHVLHN